MRTQEKAAIHILREALGKTSLAYIWILDSSLQDCETINLLLKSPICGICYTA